MGKINQGILGGFKGKVGTVIGASWNGIAYMRGIAQSVRNANTAAQQTQRNFFKDLQQLASQLSDEQLQSNGQLTLNAEAAVAELIGKPAEANFIAVAYNITKRKIGVFNSNATDPSYGVNIPIGNWGERGDSVRFYLTYAAKGENVYLRGFGSFIIKTRAEKVGRKIGKTVQL